MQWQCVLSERIYKHRSWIKIIFYSTISAKLEANLSKYNEVVKDSLGPIKKNENQPNLPF